MPPYPLQRFAREVAAMPVEEEQQFLAFLPLAARLAALGDRSQLDRWPTLAKPFQGKLAELLVERSEEGVWDLQHALDEDLGLAVIWAQDFACFLRLCGDLLPEVAQNRITAWIEEAEDTPLDEGAVEILELFIQQFPIPEEYRLMVVDSPLSATAKAALALGAEPPPTEEFVWVEAGARELVVAVLDDGAPSDETKQSFEVLHREIDTSHSGRVLVSRRLGEDWRVVVDLERADGKPNRIRSMRLGPAGARMVSAEDDTRWDVDLKPFRPERRFALLREPLVIIYHSGHRIVIK